MAKYLVTGGAGFIGSHLVDALLAEGHAVTVLDDLSVGKRDHLVQHEFSPRFEFVRGSILSPAQLKQAMTDVDGVFHLAAVVGVRYVVDDPLRGIEVNVRGTENVLAAAAAQQCRIVLASSSEVYGKSTEAPFAETDASVLGSTSIPRWSYAVSKILDEHIALAYWRQQGMPVSAIRYFNVYGPRLDPRGYGSVVARFLTQALAGQPLTVYGDGMQTRSFTYVTDAVAGTIAAMRSDQAVGRVFNIGNPQEITIRDLAGLICALTGTRSAIIYKPYAEVYGADFDETRRRLPDITQASQILGFHPRVKLEDGLQRTIVWFKEHQHELISP